MMDKDFWETMGERMDKSNREVDELVSWIEANMKEMNEQANKDLHVIPVVLARAAVRDPVLLAHAEIVCEMSKIIYAMGYKRCLEHLKEVEFARGMERMMGKSLKEG